MNPQGSDAVVSIDLGISSAYAVQDAPHANTVLVDTGPAGATEQLLAKLARASIDPATLSLIVISHCHPDHAGGAAALHTRLGVPVAVHPAEHQWAVDGRSLADPIRALGHVLRRLLPPHFPAFRPDMALEHGQASTTTG